MKAPFIHAIALAVALAAALPFAASADRSLVVPSDAPAAWRGECGSCHIAYPPSLLSARDWRAVMSSLDRHYGADASVDAATAATIGAFLERNAGPARTATTDAPRITTAPWFVREHRRFDAATWTRASIRSAANCSACHARADAGNFDEHAVRVPH